MKEVFIAVCYAGVQTWETINPKETSRFHLSENIDSYRYKSYLIIV